MRMERTYEAFREIVKKKLEKNLSAWKLSDEDLEKYLSEEEEQVRDAYAGYLHPRAKDDRKDEVRFDSAAGTVAYCLEMCY